MYDSVCVAAKTSHFEGMLDSRTDDYIFNWWTWDVFASGCWNFLVKFNCQCHPTVAKYTLLLFTSHQHIE